MPASQLTNRESFAAWLRTELSSLLASELGTFENGETAIRVIPPDAPQVGSGLHVYVDRMSNRVSDLIFTHTINLAQFDKTPDGCTRFEQACLKVRARFPTCTEQIMPYRKQLALEARFIVPVYQYASNNQALAIG